MSDNSAKSSEGVVLIVGASRGLGHAMADEFLKRGWHVIGTVLETDRTMLHDLADKFAGRVEIERLDVCDQEQIDALRQRLDGRSVDILYVNAGIAGGFDDVVSSKTVSEFIQIMVTNAWSPMRVIEGLQDIVAPTGIIGAMSSGQGSVADNDSGGSEIYRSSKAALNMFMRSYAARHADDGRSLVLMAPGWIRTTLGGANAPFGVEETIPKVVEVILAQRGTPGLKYLDRFGAAVRW